MIGVLSPGRCVDSGWLEPHMQSSPRTQTSRETGSGCREDVGRGSLGQWALLLRTGNNGGRQDEPHAWGYDSEGIWGIKKKEKS